MTARSCLSQNLLFQGCLSLLHQNINRNYLRVRVEILSSSTTTSFSKCSILRCLRMEENSQNSRYTPSLIHWVAQSVAISNPKGHVLSLAWILKAVCTNEVSPLRIHPTEEQNWMAQCSQPKSTWTDKWKNKPRV